MVRRKNKKQNEKNVPFFDVPQIRGKGGLYSNEGCEEVVGEEEILFCTFFFCSIDKTPQSEVGSCTQKIKQKKRHPEKAIVL